MEMSLSRVFHSNFKIGEKTMAEQQTKSKALIPLMAMYALVPTFAILGGTFNVIAQAFPNVGMASVSYLINGVSLSMMLTGLITGFVLGRFISYRKLSLLAIAIYVIAGSLPFFLGDRMSFTALLASRLVFGLGLGCWIPIVQSSISTMYADENKRAQVFGIGGLIFNIGMIVGVMLGGVLCQISWNATFAFYLTGIIPFILTALFMENPKDEQEAKKEKIRLPGEIFGIFLAYLIAMTISSVFSNYISHVVAETGGTPVLASSMITAMSIGSMAIAAVFGLIYKKLKHNVLMFGSMLMLLSFILLAAGGSSGSVVLLFLGAVLCGLATNSFGVGIPMIVSTRVSASSTAAALSIAMVFQNSGTFLNSPFLQTLAAINGEGAPAWKAFSGAAMASLVLVAVALIALISLGRKKQREE
jgi:predicted MFS family arabinose efflux permease